MRSKFWKAAAGMPERYHTIPGEAFDLARSEVVNWLMGQPDTRQRVFDLAREQGAIVFDKDTGLWKGVGVP